jgi:hypothetical protein
MRRIEQHLSRVFGSIFITSEWFHLVSCGIGRLATVIPEALLVITQSKIYRDVAVDLDIEKR